MDYLVLIKDNMINQSGIAKKMEMPVGTFSNKIRGGMYKFTEAEEAKLKEILQGIAQAINKALPTSLYKYKVEVSDNVAAALKNNNNYVSAPVGLTGIDLTIWKAKMRAEGFIIID